MQPLPPFNFGLPQSSAFLNHFFGQFIRSKFVAFLLFLLPAFTFCLVAYSQPFTVTSFSPWQGYGIPNGLWLTGDFNGDGKSDVFHAVESTDYANIWISNGNGTYSVNSFSPWPGYGIPNGLWLTGDFNGDGRTDIFHAVANTDYANIWLSNGDGTFSVRSFSPWPGYGIPNGIWLAGDFNGDGKTDIFHGVQGTDYANIWTSNGDGTFSVKSFSPWSGYGIPNGFWMTGDFDGDGKTDIFHGVQGTDYANIWLSNGNSTFTVHKFSPWPGYGIPNGIWLTGDFNGDGKTDVFHAVQDADYANIWTSNGDGTFSVNSFRPWAGYGIPNGNWYAGDFDGDGKTDVFHAVANADYANVWLSQGNATFSVFAFSPWSGYGITNGQYLIADINGDHKKDLVHVVNSTDYVNNWISGLPAPGQFSIDGIEVTQAVQDMAEKVPLIANKTTWARVYLNFASQQAEAVTGTLKVTNIMTGAVTTVSPINSVAVNPALNNSLRPKRESITGSLNFIIPQAFTVASIYIYSFSGLLDAATGQALSCSNCSTISLGTNFENSSPMRVRMVGLQYATGSAPNIVQHSPTPTDFSLLQSWLTRAYPTGQLISSQTTVTATATAPFTCSQSNAQLTTMRNLEVNNGTTDSRTHYVSLVSVSGTGGFYMRGCSPIPGNVSSSPTGPTNGSIVPVNVSGDTDGSFGDWYGGHELAHSYNRYHPGFCNGNSADDSNFPFPNGQISTNDGEYTGLDVGDVANSIPASVLPGASRFDIMTYCNQPQWLSSYTYIAIMNRLNQENPSGSGAPGGGAALLNKEAKFFPGMICNCVQKLVTGLKKPPAILTMSKQPPRLLQGFEIKQVPGRPYADSPARMTIALEKFDSSKIILGYHAPVVKVTAVSPLFSQPSQAPAKINIGKIEQGNFVNIVASINLANRTGKIYSVSHLHKAIVKQAVSNMRATIVLKDAQNKIIGNFDVDIQPESDQLDSVGRTGLVDAIIPEREGVRKVELYYRERLIDSRKVSVNKPVVHTVRLLNEKENPAVPRSGAMITWKASDKDKDSLSYNVEILNKQNKWEYLAIGITENYTILSPGQIKQYQPLQVRVTANDGYNESVPGYYKQVKK